MRSGTFTFALLLSLLAIIALSGCHSQDTSSKWPKLTVKEPSVELPKVNEGEKVEVKFEVSNIGKDVLRILDIKTNTVALIAYPLREELFQGESTIIKVLLDTTGRFGPQTGNQKLRVYIHSNDPENLTYTLKINGNVISDYKISPRRIYTSREKGKMSGSARVTNISDKEMLVVGLSGETDRVIATLTPPFKLPLLLKPGQSFLVDAEFKSNISRQIGKKDVVKIIVKGRTRPILIPVRVKRK